MKNWLQKWLGYNDLLEKLEKTNSQLREVNKQLLGELADHKIYVHDKVNKFVESTRIDCELGVRGKNTTVLTGVYKNRGYVEFYDLDSTEFHYLVEKLKDMKKEHLIRHVDGPLGFNFKGYFNIKGKANDFDRI